MVLMSYSWHGLRTMVLRFQGQKQITLHPGPLKVYSGTPHVFKAISMASSQGSQALYSRGLRGMRFRRSRLLCRDYTAARKAAAQGLYVHVLGCR